MTLTADMLRKIRRVELRTRKRVNHVFAGAYQAVFKGRGMEFDSVRAYEPGDDVRLIDWNVTARAGIPFVKRYLEERELTVMLIVDLSASAFFGTTGRTKHDVALELGAVLAYTAARNNDRVGLILFSDRIEQAIPPRKGRNHVLRVIRDLLEMRSDGRATDLRTALRSTRMLLKHSAVVFVLSDFLTDMREVSAELSLLAHRHDVVAVVLRDEREKMWPDAGGLVALRDAETGQERWVDAGSVAWREQFEARMLKMQNDLESVLRRAKVDIVPVDTQDDAVARLEAFFQRRLLRG